VHKLASKGQDHAATQPGADDDDGHPCHAPINKPQVRDADQTEHVDGAGEHLQHQRRAVEVKGQDLLRHTDQPRRRFERIEVLQAEAMVKPEVKPTGKLEHGQDGACHGHNADDAEQGIFK